MEASSRKSRKLGSYPFVSVVFSITMSLFVMGMFGLTLIQAKKLTRIIQENIEVQVYLDKDIAESEINRITRSLGAKNYVLKKEGEPAIYLVTRAEAAAQFIEDTGENFADFLGDNPLRDLLVLNIDPQFQSSDSLTYIKSEIERMSSVYEVAYVESLVETINDNLTKIGLFLLGFAIILLVVVIILINNTIKLALFSQRFLIRSMQLVGATGGFIRAPFLWRSLLYGLISGVVSSVLIYFLMRYANSKVKNLVLLQDAQWLAILFGSMLVLGATVGVLSTYRAVRKYLKMSLDELY